MIDAYTNLVRFLRDQRESAGDARRVFSSTRLLDVAGSVDVTDLAKVLARLVDDRLLDQFLRVKNLHGSGIQDFGSIDLVPDEVYDWKDTQQNIPVTPENIHVYYRLHTSG